MEDRSESVELTNMCMIQKGTKILVEDRKNKTWAGVTFPGGHIKEIKVILNMQYVLRHKNIFLGFCL